MSYTLRPGIERVTRGHGIYLSMYICVCALLNYILYNTPSVNDRNIDAI